MPWISCCVEQRDVCAVGIIMFGKCNDGRIAGPCTLVVVAFIYT